ncbi:MAG: ATP-binding protein [Chloroflexota bacterium]|nr:ATP-binding protein [Chloroflexota bacterium]
MTSTEVQSFEPPPVNSIEDTGLNLGFISDLVLKTVYFVGQITGYEIAERVTLPFAGVVGEALEFLKREQYCEVRGAGGLGAAAYQYTITGKGSEKAREILERSEYVGPAPVPLDAYAHAVREQPLSSITIHQRAMRKALSHLVINEDAFSRIGPAVNSGRSIFLSGPSGDGKTSIAESIGRMVFQNDIYVPHAIEVDGQIIKVFDEASHQRVKSGEQNGRTRGRGNLDQRWILVHRPVIITGGELTMEGLDLTYNEANKYYEAPFQVKANGGMLLIDDFGRQQVRPRDLLNRWIVPLEKRVDYLTLHTGRKIEVPFEVLIVFSTNLEPKDLVDEAFLRRIRHKIYIGDPTFEEYREIFKRMCKAREVPYDDEALAYLLKEHYIKQGRPMRSCQPRDIVDELIDIARYLNVEPVLSHDLIDRACEAYFVEM